MDQPRTQFDDIAAFPLCWPDGWKRTTNRKESRFKQDWTVYSAIQELQEMLRMFSAKNIVISTSVPLRRDGLPYSKPPVDGDPGAAVYFERAGQPICIPCDKYTLVEDNIHAISLTIESFRTIERHGTPYMLNAAFAGFAALPQGESYESILGYPKTLDEAEKTYRMLAKKHHPDLGGDPEFMSKLNMAIESARQKLNAKQP